MSTEIVKEEYRGEIKVVVFREGGKYDLHPYDDMSREEIDRFRRDIQDKKLTVIETLPGVNKKGLGVIGSMVYNFSEKLKKGEEKVPSTDFRLTEGLRSEFLVEV